MYAQKEIKIESALQHIGDSVTVSGWITGVKFFATKEFPSTYLRLGADKPNQELILIVMDEYGSQFATSKKNALNKQVRVNGKLRVLAGKPMIVIYSEKQITTLSKTFTSPTIYKN